MNVVDLASFCLASHGSMGAMKLQKLMYYCQAWHLVYFKQPLYSEEIQAWAYGPVVYELYKVHRGQFIVSHIPGNSAQIDLDKGSLLLVQATLRHYFQFDGSVLSKMTHEEAPWLEARRVPSGYIDQTVITHESMRKFYRSVAVPSALQETKLGIPC